MEEPMIHAAVYFIALLIAPDGHATSVRVDSPDPQVCVDVVVAYRQDVPGGKGSCTRVGR
jgi:hypothetical protein